MEKIDDILYETNNGTVQSFSYGKKLRILYRNVVLEQSYQGFRYLLNNINSLYAYIHEVRQIYYRRFLIRSTDKRFTFSLNRYEIQEMYELLGGAKTMIELNKIINEALNNQKT